MRAQFLGTGGTWRENRGSGRPVFTSKSAEKTGEKKSVTHLNSNPITTQLSRNSLRSLSPNPHKLELDGPHPLLSTTQRTINPGILSLQQSPPISNPPPLTRNAHSPTLRPGRHSSLGVELENSGYFLVHGWWVGWGARFRGRINRWDGGLGGRLSGRGKGGCRGQSRLSEEVADAEGAASAGR